MDSDLVDGSGRSLDEGDGVADRLEVLDLVVGDLDAEVLLGGDDDLDHGQRVDVQVVDERLVELDVLGGDAGDLVDDVGETGDGSLRVVAMLASLLLLVNSEGRWQSASLQSGRCAQGRVTTWAAYARPAPKAMSSAVSPLLASPVPIIRSSASGIEAAEVLPWSRCRGRP